MSEDESTTRSVYYTLTSKTCRLSLKSQRFETKFKFSGCAVFSHDQGVFHRIDSGEKNQNDFDRMPKQIGRVDYMS